VSSSLVSRGPVRGSLGRGRLRDIDVLIFPFTTGSDFTSPAAGECIHVRPSVFLTFFDQTLLNERVKVGIQSAVMNLLLVVVFEVLLDGETVGLIEASNHVQEVALETG